MAFSLLSVKNSRRYFRDFSKYFLGAIFLGAVAYTLSASLPPNKISLSSQVDDVPLPFAVGVGSSLRGAITDGGSKNGRSVKVMTFDAGEVSEVIPKNALTIALVPNASDIAHGAMLKAALASGKKVYGYKYSSYSGQAERDADVRANQGQPLTFQELFPGQFFASAEARADGGFISAFEQQKDVIFHSLRDVTLDRHSRYVFVTSDDGVSFSVRGNLFCGNGVLNNSEECDDTNDVSGDGCSAQCLIEPGYTCSGTSCQKVDPKCGNGVVDIPEECDGGAAPIPGCDNLCKVKSGFSCTGTPSVCVPDLLSLAGWYRSAGFLGSFVLPGDPDGSVDTAATPVVASLGGGRAIAVWAQGGLLDNYTELTERAIMASIYDGTTWGAPIVVDPLSDIEPAYCRNCTTVLAESDHQGKVHIFWEGPSAEVNTSGRRFNYGYFVTTFDGNSFTQKRLLSVVPHGVASEMSVRFNAAGKGLASWTALGQSGNNAVQAVRYSPSTGWGQVEEIASVTQTDAVLLNGGDHLFMRPAIGIDSTGKMIVLYRTMIYVTSLYNGSVPVYRADLLASTSNGNGWFAPATIVSVTDTWSGYSPSYPSMTYTHSVNRFSFEMRPDGTGLLAYGLTVASTEQGNGSQPREKIFAKTFDGGTSWSSATNLQPDTESYRGMQPLVSVHDSRSEGAVMWYEYYGNGLGSQFVRHYKNGVWSAFLPLSINGYMVPLFAHWSPERGRYLFGSTHKYYSDQQAWSQNRGIVLLELDPSTEQFVPAYPFDLPKHLDVVGANIAELPDHYAAVWVQPIERAYTGDPRFFTYQHILRQAVFPK